MNTTIDFKTAKTIYEYPDIPAFKFFAMLYPYNLSARVILILTQDIYVSHTRKIFDGDFRKDLYFIQNNKSGTFCKAPLLLLPLSRK